MFCPYCGNKLNEIASFCPYCGHKRNMPYVQNQQTNLQDNYNLTNYCSSTNQAAQYQTFDIFLPAKRWGNFLIFFAIVALIIASISFIFSLSYGCFLQIACKGSAPTPSSSLFSTFNFLDTANTIMDYLKPIPFSLNGNPGWHIVLYSCLWNTFLSSFTDYYWAYLIIDSINLITVIIFAVINIVCGLKLRKLKWQFNQLASAKGINMFMLVVCCIGLTCAIYNLVVCIFYLVSDPSMVIWLTKMLIISVTEFSAALIAVILRVVIHTKIKKVPITANQRRY